MIKNLLVRLDTNDPDIDLLNPKIRPQLEGLTLLETITLETYLKYAYKVVKHSRQIKDGTNLPFPIVNTQEDPYT